MWCFCVSVWVWIVSYCVFWAYIVNIFSPCLCFSVCLCVYLLLLCKCLYCMYLCRSCVCFCVSVWIISYCVWVFWVYIVFICLCVYVLLWLKCLYCVCLCVFVLVCCITTGLADTVGGGNPQVRGSGVKNDREVLFWSSQTDLSVVLGLETRTAAGSPNVSGSTKLRNLRFSNRSSFLTNALSNVLITAVNKSKFISLNLQEVYKRIIYILKTTQFSFYFDVKPCFVQNKT